MASISALVFEELDFPARLRGARLPPLASSEIREVIEFLFTQAERCNIVLVLDGSASGRNVAEAAGRVTMRRYGDTAHNMRRSHAGLPAKSRIVLDTIKYS